jgi:citrate synthase
MAEVTEAAKAETKQVIVAPPGLEGVAVAETSIGDVRGEEGFYHYRGYNAAELASQLSFEQVWHLLIEGSLPDKAQTDEFRLRTASLRTLPPQVAKLLPEIAAGDSFVPLNALRTAVSLAASVLGLEPVLDIKAEKVREQALRMTALVPVLLMDLYRAHQGKPVVQPDPDLGYAGAYLQMLTGERPEEAHVRAVEKYLILTMDHGFNASTFTARVITSTGADMGSALVGAIGALSGPLHGGAPSRALQTLDEIGTEDRAYAYLHEKVESGERLMGFGHRVYKTDDPRSTLLREVALEMGGEQARFAEHVEKTALQVLNELKPGRRLYTNVEFYAGVVMNTAGIPRDMFTPTFASSRTVGWTAAICEQAAHNRLIRPSAIYVGPQPPIALPSGYGYA